jgi:hypothetical protein
VDGIAAQLTVGLRDEDEEAVLIEGERNWVTAMQGSLTVVPLF